MFTALLLATIALLAGRLIFIEINGYLDRTLESFEATEEKIRNNEDWFEVQNNPFPSPDRVRIIELEEELKRAYDNLEMVLNSTDPLACHNIEKENA